MKAGRARQRRLCAVTDPNAACPLTCPTADVRPDKSALRQRLSIQLDLSGSPSPIWVFGKKQSGTGVPLMLNILENFQREIAEGIDAVRRQCESPDRDIAALGAARLRLSRVSSSRTRFVTREAIPRLLQMADPALRTELSALQQGGNAKRLASSQHVTTWSSAAIQSDWVGYHRAAREIWAMMEEQISRERSILGDRLRRLGL